MTKETKHRVISFWARQLTFSSTSTLMDCMHLPHGSTIGPFVICDTYKGQSDTYVLTSSSDFHMPAVLQGGWRTCLPGWMCVCARIHQWWTVPRLLQACLCSSEAEIISETALPQNETYIFLCWIGGQCWRTLQKICPSTFSQTVYSHSNKEDLQRTSKLKPPKFKPC